MNITVKYSDSLFQNTPSKVKFRQRIFEAQEKMQKLIADKVMPSALEDCTLKHYFTPMDDKYGCCTYAREMTIPKGTVIIGKIHRHEHLNFITKGKVIVSTEFGQKEYKAPCTFISEVGLKRAVYALEDTLWTTVHLTEHRGEANLEKMEAEIIAPSYNDLGLLASFKAKELT